MFRESELVSKLIYQKKTHNSRYYTDSSLFSAYEICFLFMSFSKMDADSKIKYFKCIKWCHGATNTFLRYMILNAAEYKQKQNAEKWKERQILFQLKLK